MIRIGLLVECGRDGLEVIVCRKICQLIAADHGLELGLDIVPMDNKARLLKECGSATANLLRSGCERVVILWDERPAWPRMDEELCWHMDRSQALSELQSANVPASSAHLVCIEREFESWLLFDNGMLSSVLSTATHRVRVPKQKHPHRHDNPKAAMMNLFRHAGRTYVDVEYAKKFANHLSSLNQLRKCSTFRRFEARIIGN